MKLIMADIKTNEEINSIEIEKVLNIAVFPGKKINEIAVWYGAHFDDNKEYIMVQYDNGDGFFVGEKSEVYIYFE